MRGSMSTEPSAVIAADEQRPHLPDQAQIIRHWRELKAKGPAERAVARELKRRLDGGPPLSALGLLNLLAEIHDLGDLRRDPRRLPDSPPPDDAED